MYRFIKVNQGADRLLIIEIAVHLLHPLLPQSSTASQHYNLRHRAHSMQLPEHLTQLSDSNFLTRMLL